MAGYPKSSFGDLPFYDFLAHLQKCLGLKHFETANQINQLLRLLQLRKWILHLRHQGFADEKFEQQPRDATLTGSVLTLMN